MTRVSIFLIAVAFLITVALIAGVVGHVARYPTEIRDWYGLNATRDNLGGSYLLMNDLDSTTPGYMELASETANQGKGWQPIGFFGAIYSPGWGGDGYMPYWYGLTGTFDGQGYEIRDLFINRPDEVAVGLFWGVGQEGVIKDIGVAKATVTGDAFVGTLVGWNHGTVRDSYFTGNMTGGYFVGGLVGLNEGSVSNSDSSANVTADFGVGGLVGQNLGTVNNSYSTGSVTGNYNVGGLVGYDFGTVSNSYSTANVTGNSSVGGLVGTGAGTVSNCYAMNSVSGNSSVGGLMGANSGTVLNSYSNGSVTGNSSVGGLAGDIFECTVSNSYSTASVTGNASVGGLVGKRVRSTVSNSFWDIETSGQATSTGGTGKNTTEMKDIATFSGAGWNIIAVGLNQQTSLSYVWNIVDKVTYPLLSWFLGCPQGPPTRMTIWTTPSGYLELTVSPAKVCANIGEQIEIRCSIYSLINTPIEISSVDVVLFDSYDSMIREQAMTMDSYWSAHTAYTIVGDEAYYKIKVNFAFLTFPGPKKDGKYSEYGAYSFPILVKT